MISMITLVGATDYWDWLTKARADSLYFQKGFDLFLRNKSIFDASEIWVEDIFFSGNITQYNTAQINGTLMPSVDSTFDLGSPVFRWNNVYAINLVGALDWSNITNAPSGVAAWNRSGTDVFLANDGGNVGIGTTAPGVVLDVVSAGASRFTREYATDANTARNAFTVRRSYDGGAGADGIGALVGFVAETETEGTMEAGGYIGVVLTDATAGNVDGALVFNTITASGAFSEKMRIIDTGNVGIGTTAPDTMLHLQSSTADVANPILKLENTNADPYGTELTFELDTASPAATDEIGKFSFFSRNSAAERIQYANVFTTIADATDGSEDAFFSFRTIANGTFADRMVIKDGNVGIGTISPNRLIEIASAKPFIRFNDTDGDSYNEIQNSHGAMILAADEDGAYGTDAYIRFDINNSNVMWLKQNGNVGIGTTGPAGLLHVQTAATGGAGTTALFERFEPAAANVAWTSARLLATKVAAMGNGWGTALTFNVQDDEAVVNKIGAIAAVRKEGDNIGELVFMTGTGGSSEYMRIDKDGNVGIGTASPAIASGGGLNVADSNAQSNVVVDTFDDGASRSNLFLRKSDSDTIGTKAETDDGDLLGVIGFHGVDSDSDYTYGAIIKAIQNGIASGTNVPADLYLESGASGGTNTNQLVLHHDGNVGIGTISPNRLIEIASAQPFIRFNDTDGDSYNEIQNSHGAMILAADEDGAYGTNAYIRFDINNSNVMWLKQNGNVGIGTKKPTYKLQVTHTGQSALNVSDTLFVDGTTGNVGIGTSSPSPSGAFGLHINGSDQHTVFELESGASDKDAFFTYTTDKNEHKVGYDASDSVFKIAHAASFANNDFVVNDKGQIGMGTNAPAACLHIQNDSNPMMRITDAGTDTLVLGVDGSGIGVLGIQVGDLDLRTGASSTDIRGGTSRLYIDSGTGNVGAGTTTPNERLTVIGHINYTGNITGGNLIYGQMGEKFGWDTPMTVTFPSSGVYYNVTNMTYTKLNGFTYTDANQTDGGSYLTAQVAGTYKADAHFSGAGTAAGGAYGIVIAENFDKSINEENCYAHVDGLASSIGFSIHCAFDLKVGDTVNIQVEDEADPTKSIMISTHNLVLTRIGD